MRRFTMMALAAGVGLMIGACGGSDDNTPNVDAGKLDGKKDFGPKLDGKKPDAKLDGPVVPPPDGPKAERRPDGPVTPPDGPVATTCNKDIIGQVCTETPGGECGADHTCLLTGDNLGICTCECKVDNPNTPLLNEDNCPELTKNMCGEVELVGGEILSMCLRTCAPKLGSNDCEGTIACDPRSGPSFGIFDKAICAFPGCAANTDCPVVTSTVCSVAAPTACATGQTCLTYSGGDDGRCVLPGNCDTASHLCGPHTNGSATAQVGDPCVDDTECGGNMRCMAEYDKAANEKAGGQACSADDECCSYTCNAGQCAPGLCTVNYRNGYCTIPGCAFAATLTSRACPTGSDCNNLWSGGMCQKSCTLADAASCRGNAADMLGDYECRAWQNISLGGVGASVGPVCDFGTEIPCDLFEVSGLDCTVMGEQPGNATNMTCRTLDNVVTTNVFDPQGFCLDNTASGTQMRADPTP